MSNRKLRLLMCTEASYLLTGFAIYSRQLLERLHSTGKYEIAELGNYGNPTDPRQIDKIDAIPWKFYPNMPVNEQEKRIYESNQLNQFGAWKFESICLDWKPDVVFSILDPWMITYQIYSPFRRFYKLAQMPTVDAEPLLEDWIYDYMQADAVFAYTNWGLRVMEEASSGLIKTLQATPGGVDKNYFFPINNKQQHRNKFGINQDALIIGMVARNQPRKLLPQLLEDFSIFLQSAEPSLAQRTYLYLHTSYPDIGWNIPRLLNRFGVGHKVLFTYHCKNCGTISCNLYKDVVTYCDKCHQLSMALPHCSDGVPTQLLGQIYNLFDIYVQYASCFLGHTLIKTEAGWSRIDSLTTHDKVYTHNGNFSNVIKTMNRNYTGDIFNVRCWCDETIISVTSEHPFYAISSRSLNKHVITQLLDQNKDLPDPEFIPISELNKGDFIAYKIPNQVIDINIIDLAKYSKPNDYIYNDMIFVKGGKRVPRYINVDNNFCRLLGLYAADGSTNSTSQLTITLNKNEIELQQFALQEMGKLIDDTAKYYEYKNRKAVNITISSKPLWNLMKELCKKGINKSLPQWIEYLPHDKQKFILMGLFEGDGHYSKQHHKSVLATISPVLANQIKTLLQRLRIRYSCTVQKQSSNPNRIIQYRFEVVGNVSKLDFTQKCRKSQNFYYKDYYFRQIRTIDKIPYNGLVYNLEVDADNSYTTKIGHVHNCEGLGIPLIEAAYCGIPLLTVNYSGMTDFVNYVGAKPIKPLGFINDVITGRYMALPDRNDFICQLNNLLNLPSAMRLNMGLRTMETSHKYFNWDDTVDKWMKYFDSVIPNNNWNNQPSFHQIPNGYPDGLSSEKFVNWCLINVAGRPELVNSYTALKMIKELTWGVTSNSGANALAFNDMSMLGVRPRISNLTRDHIFKQMVELGKAKLFWENQRCLSQ